MNRDGASQTRAKMGCLGMKWDDRGGGTPRSGDLVIGKSVVEWGEAHDKPGVKWGDMG